MNRRNFIQSIVGGTAAAALGTPLFRAFAGPEIASDEYFIFIHAQGAWDITVGLDPRNERVGLIEPGSTNTIDIAPLKKWVSRTTPLDGSTAASGYSFELVTPPSGPLTFGPAIGDLLRHHCLLYTSRCV